MLLDFYKWYHYNTSMSSIHIRNIDEKTLSSLKNLAARHHRSLQGELHFILDRAAELDIEEDSDEELNLITVNSGLDSSWSREDIYDNNSR